MMMIAFNQLIKGQTYWAVCSIWCCCSRDDRVLETIAFDQRAITALLHCDFNIASLDPLNFNFISNSQNLLQLHKGYSNFNNQIKNIIWSDINSWFVVWSVFQVEAGFGPATTTTTNHLLCDRLHQLINIIIVLLWSSPILATHVLVQHNHNHPQSPVWIHTWLVSIYRCLLFIKIDLDHFHLSFIVKLINQHSHYQTWIHSWWRIMKIIG